MQLKPCWIKSKAWPWVSFKEAIKRAKITERTGLNKRKALKKLDPKLYKQLFTDTRPIKVKDPEGVAFLRTDIKRFKKKLKVVTDAVVKRQNGFDHITKVYGERIMTTPVTLAIEPDIKEILASFLLGFFPRISIKDSLWVSSQRPQKTSRIISGGLGLQI